MVCVPDLQSGLERGEFKDEADLEAVQKAVVDYCERVKTSVAILDVPKGYTDDQALDGRSRFDSKYAAIYYPWIMVQDQAGKKGATRLVPPCGHVAGLTAHLDNEEGVHRELEQFEWTEAFGYDSIWLTEIV